MYKSGQRTRALRVVVVLGARTFFVGLGEAAVV